MWAATSRRALSLLHWHDDGSKTFICVVLMRARARVCLLTDSLPVNGRSQCSDEEDEQLHGLRRFEVPVTVELEVRWREWSKSVRRIRLTELKSPTLSHLNHQSTIQRFCCQAEFIWTGLNWRRRAESPQTRKRIVTILELKKKIRSRWPSFFVAPYHVIRGTVFFFFFNQCPATWKENIWFQHEIGHFLGSNAPLCQNHQVKTWTFHVKASFYKVIDTFFLDRWTL